MSSDSETEAVRRVAPNAPLLSKPFRAEALDAAVRGALAKGRGLRTYASGGKRKPTRRQYKTRQRDLWAGGAVPIVQSGVLPSIDQFEAAVTYENSAVGA